MTAVEPDAAPEAKPAARALVEKGPSRRIEEYDAVRPDGQVVRVRRDIDTGATEIVGPAD